MNIFYLDDDPKKCAEYHADRHIVKMPIETTQMLCTNLRERFGIEVPYKSVYINHPCTVWVGESHANFEWMWDFGMTLCQEYSYRYNKLHKCQLVLESLVDIIPDSSSWTTQDFTPRPLCVAPEFKRFGPVVAYRLQYLYRKQRMFKWTGRLVPYWIADTRWTEAYDYVHERRSQ